MVPASPGKHLIRPLASRTIQRLRQTPKCRERLKTQPSWIVARLSTAARGLCKGRGTVMWSIGGESHGTGMSVLLPSVPSATGMADESHDVPGASPMDMDMD